MVQAGSTQHPDLLCGPALDEGPIPSFLGKPLLDGGANMPDLSWLVNSMARVEQRLDNVVSLLSTGASARCHKSKFLQGVCEASHPPCDQNISHAHDEATSTHSINNAVASDRSHTRTQCGRVTIDVDAIHGDDQCVLQSSGHSNDNEQINGDSHEKQNSAQSDRIWDGLDACQSQLTYKRSNSFVLGIYEKTIATKAARGCAAKVVTSTYFDIFISVIVTLNALMLGVQVDLEAANKTPNNWFKYFEWACSVIFTVELALRIWAVGIRRMFGTKSERISSTMDAILVVFSIMDTLLDILVTSGSRVTATASVARLIKMLRIGRLLRPLRTVVLLSELRIIANMIASSFRSLFWLLCILLVFTYCLSLVLTQGVASYLKDIAESSTIPEEYTDIKDSFGSVWLTMYSLYLSITSGRNWGEFSSLISNAGTIYSVLVCLFVFINLFSVLNIVTGVFVDTAVETAKYDRSIMIDKTNQSKDASLQHLVSLLYRLDKDGDGTISKTEFFMAMKDPDVQEFMDALGVDSENAAEVFLLLDEDRDNSVNLQEFVRGMERIRGEAKSIDIQMIRLYMRRIVDELACMPGLVSKNAFSNSCGA